MAFEQAEPALCQGSTPAHAKSRSDPGSCLRDPRSGPLASSTLIAGRGSGDRYCAVPEPRSLVGRIRRAGECADRAGCGDHHGRGFSPLPDVRSFYMRFSSVCRETVRTVG
jgi:hypothetical protein